MDQKQVNILLLAISAVLFVGSVALFWPPAEKITQGLDVQGGLSVILQAQETTGTPVTAALMERAELIITNRVNGLGVKEATVQQQGSDALLIQIPGIDDPQEALDVLGSTGQLEFVNVASITDSATIAALSSSTGGAGVQLDMDKYKEAVFMTGDVVTDSSVSQDPNTAQIVVNLTMNPEGTTKWGEFTSQNVGRQVAIVLDGTVQSAPVVNEPILDGRTQISGDFTAEDAKRLQTVLQTGALPVSLEALESRIVGPTLGQDALQQGVMAALIGLGLVALYVLVFYRGLGLLTVGALVVFASIFLGILAGMSQLGYFAVTLPGIAGIVLTIGLAADSSILILERFKEEVRMGKTIRSAANSGSKHGLWTSIDADLVTLVSAAMLYIIAIGPVRGFALTLMIGIFCDILMMVLFKRPALMLLAESIIPKAPAFWGVDKERVMTGTSAVKGGGVNG